MESAMNQWPVQEAKARFSELIEQSLGHGAQIITRHGRATAVVLPYTQWLTLSAKSQRDVKSVLLAPSTPQLELVIPARGALKLRSVEALLF
jgi:antitoxin Phd